MLKEESEGTTRVAQCALYKAGHQAHHIQVRLSWAGEHRKNYVGRVVGIDAEGWISVETGGAIKRFWTHDINRAQTAFEASAGRVGLVGYGLLAAQSKKGMHYICVADEIEGATPCASLRVGAAQEVRLAEMEGQDRAVALN